MQRKLISLLLSAAMASCILAGCGNTPGVDTPVTLLWLAKTAYPDLFEDIDIIEETKTYYQEVFGITLTDVQAASIFNPIAQAGSGF